MPATDPTGDRRDANIRVRDMRFALDERTPSRFCPGHPEFSHATNAFMAALPHLEPYFIHNIREAGAQAGDPALSSQIALFVAQEARHAQHHRTLNGVLAQRYPELPRLEREIKERLDRSRQRHSLGFRMAYTAGYEAITYQLVGFMMDERRVWLSDADPDVLALLCWHGAEEVEHKSVAYDAFQAIHGGYTMRVLGLLAALAMTVRDIQRMVRYMLEVDGTLRERACRQRLRRVRLAFARGLLPRLRHYLRPRYHPSHHPDPPEMRRWLARYAAGEDLSRLSPHALDEPTASSAQR
jgi:predicted metal-dependent hydrolase